MRRVYNIDLYETVMVCSRCRAMLGVRDSLEEWNDFCREVMELVCYQLSLKLPNPPRNK